EIKPLAQREHDTYVTIVGEVYAPPQIVYGRKTRTMFNVMVEGATIRVVMFFPLHSVKQLEAGTTVTLTGKWDAHRLQITANSFKIDTPSNKKEIESLYSVKASIKMNRLRTFIKRALELYGKEIDEILPETYLKNYKLPLRKDAVESLHFPENEYVLK